MSVTLETSQSFMSLLRDHAWRKALAMLDTLERSGVSLALKTTFLLLLKAFSKLLQAFAPTVQR